MVVPNGKNPEDGFRVEYKQSPVELFSRPPVGISYVNIRYSAPCGSDGGSRGYYWGGRFHKDLYKDTEKLNENIKLLKEEGIKDSSSVVKNLLYTPNHEGAGVVASSEPNKDESPREIAGFFPVFSSDHKHLIGLNYGKRRVDFQKMKKGQRVVVDAALRCDRHWQIAEGGFPPDCHRDTKNGHIRKRVPGHMEFPGFSFSAPKGLPYPNHMLSVVPKQLNKWIDEDAKTHEQILVMVEPLSCCLEAFHPVLLSGEKPQVIVILGDGPNSALLTLVASVAFPESMIYVIGRTDRKLASIASFNPDRIHPIKEGRQEHEIGRVQLKKILEGKKQKVDILVPTIIMPTLSDYADLVSPSGRVIVWAAGQVGETDPFRGVGDPAKLHHSYGGKNKMEWSALQMLDALAETNPKPLSALVSYPFYLVPLSKAADVMGQWLTNKGRFNVEMDGRMTSAKIIFGHGIKS